MLIQRVMWLPIRPAPGFRPVRGLRLALLCLTSIAALACTSSNPEPARDGEGHTTSAPPSPSSITPPGTPSSGALTATPPAGGAPSGTHGSPPPAPSTETNDSAVTPTAGQGSTTNGEAPSAATETGSSDSTTSNDSGGSTADTTADTPTMADARTELDPDLTAADLVARMGLGWNLGNSLDAPEDETAWGNPPVTPELLAAVAAAGFGVVRVPVTWSLHLGDAPEFSIDPAWMARVEEVVGYVIDAGMIAIINLHHDGADGYDGVEWLTLNDENGAVNDENNARVEAQFVAVWQQISSRFANWGHQLVFESMNEIHDGYDAPDPAYYEIINHLNQVFVDLIRGSGGNNPLRHLVVPGYNTNIGYTLEGFEAPQDPAPDKLILSVHYYDPWSFAGEGSTNTWGAQSPSSDSWGQEDWVVSQFDELRARYVDQGLPVIIGEYGAIQQDGFDDYRRYYLEYVTKAAHDRGMAPIYWDNGGLGSGADKFALFDRSTYEVTQPELLQAMTRAVSMSYALEQIALP